MLSDSGESPARVQLWRSRWDEILNDGLGREADIRWFTAEQGFVLICRELPRQELTDLRADPLFDALLADLDDRLVAFPGPLPSDRARALVDVALAEGPAAVLPESRAALMPAGGDPYDDAIRAQVNGMITDLRLWFAAGAGAESRRHHEVPIAVSHHARGDVVLVSMREHPVVGVAPDLVHAPFQRLDAGFAHAVEHAMVATGTRGGARYLARSRRTGAPVDAIGGRSAGLGAALALRRLQDAKAAPLDPDWVFTGAVEADGTFASLLGPDGASEYGAKLTAVGRGALVYPAVDRTEVERLGELRAPDLRLEAVATVNDAERLAARHVEGRRAYQRAIEPGHPVSKLAIVAITALAAVLIGLWINHQRTMAGAEAMRVEAAGPDPLEITVKDPDGPRRFQIDRVEVTNARYRLCVQAEICPAPDRSHEAFTIWDETLDLMPVTGITAADAEVFCQYGRGKGWSVPTFNQYAEAMQVDLVGSPAADTDGSVFPRQLMPVTGGGVSNADPYRLRGNVAEWTRTRCVASVCRSEPMIAGARPTSLTTFGVSYDRARGAAPISDAWFIDPYFSQSQRYSASPTFDVGFRCASLA